MEHEAKHVIRSFRDLHVYQGAYQAMLIVHKELLPKLPASERFDLRDQLSRSTKAVPRLIAEGFSKKHQKAGFQKYLDDAHTESNESIVGIEQCRDLYGADSRLCNDLTDRYDKISRQLFNLAEAWDAFKNRRRQTSSVDSVQDASDAVRKTHDDTRGAAA